MATPKPPLFEHAWSLRVYGMLEDGSYGVTFQEGEVRMIGEWTPTDDEIREWIEDKL